LSREYVGRNTGSSLFWSAGTTRDRRFLSPTQNQRATMKKLLLRFVQETEGQDLIEYALLAALIGLATTVAMGALAGNISSEFTNIGSSVVGAS
jgi:pilus assembly protein Flp/PilA